MALVSPLKQEVEKATKDAEHLNRMYNVYFSGGEDDPPRNARKQLDALVSSIKSQLTKPASSSDRFQANTFISRYQILTSKWDKTMRAIETGIIPRPKKRK